MARKQRGQILRIGEMWYVRYWDKRNVNGTVERKRVAHPLGPVTTRGKHPPADIVTEAEHHMMTVNNGRIAPERTVTLGDFVENVYLPWVDAEKRASTARNYRDIWELHLREFAGAWFKKVRTYEVQQWLNRIGEKGLSKNSLRRYKSFISGIFKYAKQQGFFEGENPARDTSVNPKAPAPEETYAYTLEDVQGIIAHLPEPSATAFAIAAFTGLRMGEIQGLRWEDYDGESLHVRRSIWNGRVNDPKTRKSSAPVPVIRQLAERLELHKLRCGSPQSGPMFANSAKKPENFENLRMRSILPALNRCTVCGKPEHEANGHEYKRDSRIPEWHGWHAARRGLGSNLYRLGVSELVIQRILRHANVNTTTSYYIKTVADDVRGAMERLENAVPVAH